MTDVGLPRPKAPMQKSSSSFLGKPKPNSIMSDANDDAPMAKTTDVKTPVVAAIPKSQPKPAAVQPTSSPLPSAGVTTARGPETTAPRPMKIEKPVQSSLLVSPATTAVAVWNWISTQDGGVTKDQLIQHFGNASNLDNLLTQLVQDNSLCIAHGVYIAF